MCEKENRKYGSIFIGYFGFNEANTNIHLAHHIYSNVDLEILRLAELSGISRVYL